MTDNAVAQVTNDKIHIGTSGWSYKDWREIFYPPKLAPTAYLAYYSRHFAVTEINSSFYHLPLPSTVKKWAAMTPEDFLFCPKISRFITHIKKLNDPEHTLGKFFDVFEPIKQRLGPVLIQLPASVPFDPDKTSHFFDVLCTVYPGYRFALEIRHHSWECAEALSLLRRYGVSWVIAESGGRWHSQHLITADLIYIRFHGPEGNYATPYTPAFLEDYAGMIREWATAGHELWIFFNNDYFGNAIDNARTLEGYLELAKKMV